MALLALHPPRSPLTSSGQRNRASWASQPQKSVTLLSCLGGKATKSTRTCGALGGKKNYYYTCYHLYGRYLQLYTETNHVSSVYSVAAVLYLQSVLHVLLCCTLNMFCTFTLALSAVCVQWPVWLFVQFLNFVLSRYVAQVLSE